MQCLTTLFIGNLLGSPDGVMANASFGSQQHAVIGSCLWTVILLLISPPRPPAPQTQILFWYPPYEFIACIPFYYNGYSQWEVLGFKVQWRWLCSSGLLNSSLVLHSSAHGKSYSPFFDPEKTSRCRWFWRLKQ